MQNIYARLSYVLNTKLASQKRQDISHNNTNALCSFITIRFSTAGKILKIVKIFNIVKSLEVRLTFLQALFRYMSLYVTYDFSLYSIRGSRMCCTKTLD